MVVPVAQLHNRFRLRVALVTALALLFAQLGAMTHAYSHGPRAAPTAVQQQVPASHDFCNDCLNFAPLLAAAGAPAALHVAIARSRGAEPPTPLATLIGHRSPLAFRSRAPPVTP